MGDVMEKEQLDQLKKDLTIASQTIAGTKGIIAESERAMKQREVIEEWKSTTSKDKKFKAFDIPRQLIKCLLSTQEHNGIILFGEGGIGKTILTLKEVKESLEPNEWQYSNGYTTPLALYEFLYLNAESKLLILDDVEGLFDNHISMSILKGALWDSDGKRIVQYKSKSKQVENLPEQFVMRAKIIILCNRIPNEKDISVKAMISRTIPYELSFSYAQKLSLCKQFVNANETLNEKEREQVIRILEENTNEATKDFNFRTMKKLIAFVKYNEGGAEELFNATTETDDDLAVYLEAIKNNPHSVTEQIIYFMANTGKKRRTFFRIKGRIKKSNAFVPSKKNMAQGI